MSWIQKQKLPQHPREAVEGRVMQKPFEVTKPQKNQVQATDSHDESKAVMEKESFTKDVDDEESAVTD